MLRAWAAGVFFVTMVATPAVGQVTAADALTGLMHGYEQYSAGKCPEALVTLKAVVTGAGFAHLDGNRQLAAIQLMATCSYNTKDYGAAAALYKVVTDSKFARPSDWVKRAFAANAAKDYVDASNAFTYLAENNPDALAKIYPSTFADLVKNLRATPDGQARALKLLTLLFAVKWREANAPADYSDYLWQFLVQLDLEGGRLDHARLVAATITNTRTLETLWADKRFDPVTGGVPAAAVMAKIYEAALSRSRVAMTENPDYLSYLSEHVRLLYQLDHQDEALALLDKTIAKMKVSGSFRDQDDIANWLHNQRSSVLAALGRVDDALVELEAASKLAEHGNPDNVSQTINLAGLYMRAGRPSDALKVLEHLDLSKPSPFGVMQAESERVCSLAQLGAKSDLEKPLTYGRDHADDAPEAAVRMLLCANDVDGAAKVTLHYLADRDNRDALLGALHIHVPQQHSADLPFGAVLTQRWKALAQRDDITAAIEPVGRILSLPTITH